jgi:anti-anti-sigma factor
VEVRREAVHGAVVYRISGKLDAFTATSLDSSITVEEGNSFVILDMREVTYVSSTGLRAIIQAAKRAKASKGEVAVFGLQTLVKEVFEVSGLGKIIIIASDETEARSKLGITA